MTVFSRFVADRRRAQIGWSIGMTAGVFLVLVMYPSVKNQAGLEQTFQNLPVAVKAMVGAADFSIISAVGYLHSRLFVTVLPLLLTIFGIGLGARAIGGSEADGSLEYLLAHPVTRGRVAGERYAATCAMLVALGVVAALATLLFGALVGAVGAVGAVPPVRVVSACLGATCMALLFSTLAFSVGCVTGRRTTAISVATVAAVAGYLIHTLFSLSPSLAWMRPISPWHWYLGRIILRDGFSVATIVTPLAASAALLAFAVWWFRRRDLR